ncbi:MAG TPA: diaminohydroxyphosphoribosylaminopyrimidine deaminase [Cytophagales bacterium]|jgi:nucleoside-diphosphate-sugar epimerase|nr:diaminohydroxyphosphoribosylaminopyrimidine deaminase [Cytophagales bacterium]
MDDSINPKKPILVTGASGYIASWIVKYLLEKGHTVHGTVRSKKDERKTAHLSKIQSKDGGKLKLFEADLLNQGDFDEAIKGCELVIHTASPFKFQGIKDPQKELIDPALIGTRNVLEAANRNKSTKRVVLTSSVVAIFGDPADIKGKDRDYFTESDWNTTSNLKHQPYSFSKTLAEQEAWKMQEKQSQWDLVVINPGFVMGPSLSKRIDSASVSFIKALVDGTYKSGAPELHFGFVDVRDVAKAHILAGFKPEATGRHILVAGSKSMMEVVDILKSGYNDLKLPSSTVPKFLLYLIGPFNGFSWKYINRNVGIPLKFDNSYSKKDLGMEYTGIEETLTDHVAQLKSAQLL